MVSAELLSSRITGWVIDCAGDTVVASCLISVGKDTVCASALSEDLFLLCTGDFNEGWPICPGCHSSADGLSYAMGFTCSASEGACVATLPV